MQKSHLKTSALVLAIAVVTSGCASAPASPTAGFAENELRKTDSDLVFATEFPVANKADAILRADSARKAGDVERALYFYVKALNFDPEDPDLLAAIGLLHQYQGNDLLAARAYTLALKSRPDFLRVREARGLILLAHEEDERARNDLARAIELNRDSWRAHNGLGMLSDRSGEHGIAQSHYNIALALNPESSAILNNRGYSRLLSGDLPGAEADLKQAAAAGHEQAWINLGRVYAQQGRYELAVEALEEVLPTPDAFNRIAETSMSRGDYDAAANLLEQAIALSPTYFPQAEENLVQLKIKASGS